jgi:zinc/manganese transport system substrate-binding protein
MKYRLLILGAMMSVLGVAVIGAQTPLKVVTTFSVLGDVVQNIAGDSVELSVLVGADSDSHTYEPSPSDAIMLNEAQVIFEIGVNFEAWLDELYTASESVATRVVVTANIELLEFAEHHDEHEGDDHKDEHETEATETAEEHEGEEHEGEEHEGEEHGEYDPHIWHDPNAMLIVVENIRLALITADPANEATYTANAQAYSEQLIALDAYIRTEIEKIPSEQRILFTSHDTFGYFGAQYGFMIDSALESVSTEASDPSAADLATLITEIKKSGVKAIFAENIANSDLMQRIADDAGVTLAPTLYTDALGAEDSLGASYLDMVKYNVDTIVTALSQ